MSAQTPTTPPRSAPEASFSDDPVREFSDALQDLLRVYQFRDRQRTCIHGISVTECYALEILVTGAPLTVTELARQMQLDKSTASRAVATLEERGHVGRSEHPDDARCVAIRATESGRRLHEAIREGLRERQRRLLSEFDAATTGRIARLLRELARAEPSRSAPTAPDVTEG